MKIFCVFVIVVIASCNTEAPSGNPSIDQIDKQGHRGCRGLLPENTIPAMLNALSLGVNTLELDVVISGDSQVVVSHEPFFNHEISLLPNGDTIAAADEKQYNIYKMTYDEVKKFDVGTKRHSRFPLQQKFRVEKPLLTDLIANTEAYAKKKAMNLPRYNIEIKSLPQTDAVFHPLPREFADRVMYVVAGLGIAARTTIQSFDVRPLQYIHSKDSAQEIALLVEANDGKDFSAQLASLGFDPDVYSPEYSLVTDELIKQCHMKGIKIIPWTVNHREDMRRLIVMGVDGIITDYPNYFQRLDLKKKYEKENLPN